MRGRFLFSPGAGFFLKGLGGRGPERKKNLFAKKEEARAGGPPKKSRAETSVVERKSRGRGGVLKNS